MTTAKKQLYSPYMIMLVVYAFFVVFAFFVDTPAEIASGLWRIFTSSSLLISDYMAIGGMGATLINAALVGLSSVLMLVTAGVRPNGSTIMAMWLSVGFAMFGKNMFNVWPLTLGVWLYAKYKKEPFINFTLAALLSATLSPVVSAIAFHPQLSFDVALPVAILVGVLSGFIFAPLSAFLVRVHSGYNLYNMGFTGGLISTFIMAALGAFDISMHPEVHWATNLNLPAAVLLYIIAAALILYGLFSSGKFRSPAYRGITRHTGRLVTDIYVLHGDSVYFNMGILCAFATTLMLFYGADLNGATLCGIFTIIGFGAFGKHLRNVVPIIVGALICTFANQWDPTAPANTLAILFSTGLAPIAGQFGVGWGVAAGFLHVATIMHIGSINSGLNLYNNGYAAGFVAMLLVPIIMAVRISKEE